MLLVGAEHEFGHALAAKAFGIPIYKITASYILLGNIINPTAKTVISFSGGLAGFLFSMSLVAAVYFGAALLRSFLKNHYPVFARNRVQRSLCHPWALVEGAYIAFLTFGFSELVGAFWEGFFNDSYTARSGLSVLALFVGFGVLAWLIVFVRTKKHHHFT